MADDAQAGVGTRDLTEFLALVETHLEDPITLVGVGGTALTLLGAKPSTIDIDFTGPATSITAFEEAADREPHGYEIDAWIDGTVFMVNLPEDYLRRSRAIETRLQHIELRALHPVDIVITKIARYDQRDREDILRAVEVFDIQEQEVAERAEEIEYVGGWEAYQANLEAALRTCFSEQR